MMPSAVAHTGRWSSRRPRAEQRRRAALQRSADDLSHRLAVVEKVLAVVAWTLASGIPMVPHAD